MNCTEISKEYTINLQKRIKVIQNAKLEKCTFNIACSKNKKRYIEEKIGYRLVNTDFIVHRGGLGNDWIISHYPTGFRCSIGGFITRKEAIENFKNKEIKSILETIDKCTADIINK